MRAGSLWRAHASRELKQRPGKQAENSFFLTQGRGKADKKIRGSTTPGGVVEKETKPKTNTG
jgi:hypothetical protein